MPATYRAVLTLTAALGDQLTGTEDTLTLEDRTPGQALDAFLGELTTKQPAYTDYERLTFTLEAT